MNIVGIGAHPDDIEIYFLGTMLKYQKNGHDIYFVVVTNGDKGGELENIIDIRKKESIMSASIVGVKPIFLDFIDGELVDNINLNESIKNVLMTLKADIVFTHSNEDYHKDHRVLSNVVCKQSECPVLLADTYKGINFEPQIYVNITKEYDNKVKCIKEHKSQMNYNYLEVIECQNKFRGYQAQNWDYEYAEAFKIYKSIYSQSFLKIID